jgi:hypothetical protein
MQRKALSSSSYPLSLPLFIYINWCLPPRKKPVQLWLRWKMGFCMQADRAKKEIGDPASGHDGQVNIPITTVMHSE